jgi:hypothetical protein
MHNFYSFKIGPEVVLAARWRPKAKMMSPFESPTPILYRLSVENFRVYIVIWLEIWHPGSEIWGFLGVLTPKCNFLSMRRPKGTSLQQTASFEPSCMQIGSAVFSCGGLQEKKVR